MSKRKANCIGPCRAADEKWVVAWYNSERGAGNYEWIKNLRKYRWTWHQIRSLINGKGYK